MTPSEPPNLIHPTYRHLARSVRLAALTLAQWTQLVAAGAGAWLLAHVLPFSGTLNLSIAVTLAGMPAAAALAAGHGAVRPLALARAELRSRRRAGVFVPGMAACTRPVGYVLTADEPTPRGDAA